jgi:CheY-like chemotaxis protein
MSLKKVLLVDDDEGFNFLNRIVFTDNNVSCQVDEVADGSAALDYLQQTTECPDVILLDINMPVMDGFEFLEQFEKNSKCSSLTKVFILTSSQREEDKDKSLANKYVKGYFDKPLSDAHVRQIIDSVNK